MAIFNIFKKKNANEAALSNTPVSDVANPQTTDIASIAERMLLEVDIDLSAKDTVKLPLTELSLLGASVSSLLPPLRTVTQTMHVDASGLYQLVNVGAGDALKKAKDGTLWGAIKTNDGVSQMGKFVEAGPFDATMKTVSSINPATIMTAAALASIEKELGEIAEMEKKILSILEQDKESEVEGDLKTLANIIREYKYNWDNPEYTQNHHKLALDIKRKADQNMIFYRKQVADQMKNNPGVYLQQFADDTQRQLQKHFKYYQMSLFIYSFASFLEVILLGNYHTDYIHQVSDKIEDYALEYRQLYTECSNRLENIASGSVEAIALKGLGAAAKAAGSLAEGIPFLRDTQVNEWLSSNGNQLEKDSNQNAQKLIAEFATISNPGCATFIEELKQVERIYNRTSAIYLDKDNVYLVQ